MASKKVIAAAHAAIDELFATADADTQTAIGTILAHLTRSEGGVVVEAKAGGRKPPASAKDDDDLDLGDKPARRGRKPATAKEEEAPRRGRKPKVEEEPEDDGEDGEVEMPELGGISDEDIKDFCDALIDAGVDLPDDIAEMSIRETSAKIKELGGDPAYISGEGDRSDRLSNQQGWLASVRYATDAVVESYIYDEIVEAWEELTEDEVPSFKGTAKAKHRQMAEAYVVLAVSPDEE